VQKNIETRVIKIKRTDITKNTLSFHGVRIKTKMLKVWMMFLYGVKITLRIINITFEMKLSGKFYGLISLEVSNNLKTRSNFAGIECFLEFSANLEPIKFINNSFIFHFINKHQTRDTPRFFK